MGKRTNPCTGDAEGDRMDSFVSGRVTQGKLTAGLNKVILPEPFGLGLI